MKGIIRYETNLEVFYYSSFEDTQGYNVGGFKVHGNAGFAAGQRVVVTVEALEEPGE